MPNWGCCLPNAYTERLFPMELQEEVTIPAQRDKVLASLTDADVLRQCIPGCDELVQVSATEYTAKVVLKIGPVKAKFSGNVTLDMSAAPDRLTLSGQGDGGIAGFAKGGADVTLVDAGDDTILTYQAKAETGGKIAQLGSRLMVSTARKLSKSFFAEFLVIMGGAPAGAPAEDV